MRLFFTQTMQRFKTQIAFITLFRIFFVAIMLTLITSKGVLATTITVSSIADLQTAINNAVPGDVIILSNGIYTTTADISVNKKGTALLPITIAAQTIGGVEIKGTGGFSINSPAAYIIIKGFKFTHSAGRAKMNSGTNHIRWTHNFFDTPGSGEYLQINGNDQEVDFNTFQNKEDPGKFITVRGTGSQIAERLWIHHNYFKTHLPGGGNGNETLQFGLSGYSLSNSNSIVEYNLFEDCDGENEGISVKASQVTLRYNTFRNNPAQFTLRHGNRCQVYGNYFINTPGLRIFGDDHVVHSNYFESCSIALDIGNGDGEVANGDPLTSHDRPDRVLIAFNTLVNNSSNFKQGGRTNGLGATFITVANNIVQGGGAAASIAGPYTNPTWEGNIIFNTNGAGSMPATGYTIIDPMLAKDITGTFHLTAGSPAIDAVTKLYPSITSDMDGQSRTSPFDVGADEISGNPAVAHVLVPAEVGFNATTSDLPIVSITSPADKAILDGNKNVTITATANSFDGSIDKVEFFVDDNLLGEDTSAPYSLNWIAIEGTHNIKVKSFDNKGSESLPAVISVTVNPTGAKVKITSPLNAATFTAPASITINATATDSLTAVTKVEFFNGTTKLGEDLTNPYSFSWTNVATGSYILQAKSTNNLGKISISVPVNITVTPPVAASFDITDNGGIISAQFPNTSKPSENFPSLIDNNKNTKYFRSGKTALWVQYQSTVPAIVVKYTLTSANDVPNRDPRDWNLQGSNTGNTNDWTTIDTRTGQTFSSRFLTKTYTCSSNTTPYVYYRLNITNNNGDTGTQLAEWELYERRTQTISFQGIADKTYGDEPFELTAGASSGLPVTLELVSGPATFDGTFVTITGAGTITVRASQAGNDNYFPVVAEPTIIVNKAPQNIEFEPIDTKTYGDEPFELIADIDTELPLTFELVSGPASISGSLLTILGAGDVTVRVSQAGNENYFPASVERTFTVQKASQIITFETIEDKTYGDEPFELVATVNTGFPLLIELVSGPASISGSLLTILGAGDVTVRVSQAGNENYLPATVEQTFTINKAAQSITFEEIPPANQSDIIELSASASSGLPVSFEIVDGPGALAGNTLAFTDQGEVIVRAMQEGNENYLPAPGVEQVILVYADDAKKDGLLLIANPNPTKGKVMVKLDNKKDKEYSFAVYDKNGQVVDSSVIPKSHKMFEIDLQREEDGIYYLWVSDGVEIWVRRIIKE